MKNLISVDLQDDGNINFRVHDSPLSVAAYGRVLETLAITIAKMKANAKTSAQAVMFSLMQSYKQELANPTAPDEPTQLQ